MTSTGSEVTCKAHPPGLLTGAWINPWYTGSAFGNSTTIVALASVPDWTWATDPQYGFNKEKVDYFRSKTGAKVLISFGGADAVGGLWSTMAQDPDTYASKLADFLHSVGADGIDFDYESELSQQTSEGLKTIMIKLSRQGFILTLSVLGGSYDFYKPIIDANVVNHIIVLCYNGGMFVHGHLSGNEDWKGWMNLWLKYMKEHTNKLIIGMCIQYSIGTKYYAGKALVEEGVSYCKSRGVGGMFFWWYSDDSPGASTIGSLINDINC